MFWVLWLAAAAVLVLVEMSTLSFYCLLLAGAALAAMVLALVNASIWVQLFGFIVVSFVLYAVLLPWLRSRMKDSSEQVGQPGQRCIGMSGTVVQAITPEDPGQVRISGEVWTAVADETLHVGEHVVVLEVRVTKLVVKRGTEV